MKLYIHTEPLKNENAVRGIGQYTRMLVEALKKYTSLQLVEAAEHADIVHYPFFDLFFLTLPFAKSKPTVVTIHDVIPLLYPDAYPKGTRGTIKLWLQQFSLKGAKHIITDSDTSTRDVIRYLHQPEQKVSTVYLAPDERFKPATKELINLVKATYSLNKPYFLYVGDINYNKNLDTLLTAFSTVKQDVELVIVSKALRRDNPAAGSLWQLIDSLGLASKLRILTDIGLAGMEDLRGIYSGAIWYIQPSFYEGFGLPVLESQACGTPVISSTGGSLPEISGDSTLQFEPSHPEGLAHLMEKVLVMNNNDREAYITKGLSNIRRFSWQKTASQMMEIYEKTV